MPPGKFRCQLLQFKFAKRQSDSPSIWYPTCGNRASCPPCSSMSIPSLPIAIPPDLTIFLDKTIEQTWQQGRITQFSRTNAMRQPFPILCTFCTLCNAHSILSLWPMPRHSSKRLLSSSQIEPQDTDNARPCGKPRSLTQTFNFHSSSGSRWCMDSRRSYGFDQTFNTGEFRLGFSQAELVVCCRGGESEGSCGCNPRPATTHIVRERQVYHFVYASVLI